MDNAIDLSGEAGGRRGSTEFRGPLILAAPALADGEADDVPVEFGIAGEDGAFTYEVLVKFDMLPSESPQWAMSLISMDNERSGERLFNFRIESSELLVFLPLQRSVGGAALAAIPSDGPHAIDTKSWFHVAVAYDGREGVSNNTSLYWTRLEAAGGQAHLIGRGTLMGDFKPATADFTIGNEARTQWGNREAEPLVGLIDEVRISSIARDPSDFLFVPQTERRNPSRDLSLDSSSAALEIGLSAMWVDGRQVSPYPRSSGLVLPPGLHRVEFDFGVPENRLRKQALLNYRLWGVDERWSQSERGMRTLWEVLDREGRVISLQQSSELGNSRGWQTGIEDSTFTTRSEPIRLPEGARSLRLSISSGVPDTTGTLVIDNISLFTDGRKLDWWPNPEFAEGRDVRTPAGTPAGWERSGATPAIARMIQRDANAALALIDGDQTTSGTWSCTCKLPSQIREGKTIVATWEELYSVFGGTSYRATFLNVPAGDFCFEVAAATLDEKPVSSYLRLPFSVRSRIIERPAFWAALAALVVILAALAAVAEMRRRQLRKLAAFRVKNALADDRARIARDMHDDLGTRITRLTMNLALLDRDIDRDANAARERAGRLTAVARDLVSSMDGLVWSIDPANDNLDEFAERMVRLGEEVFEGSEVRCEFDVPTMLPHWPMRAAARHHLFLAIKEALHNVLQHAGPCRVKLQMRLADEEMIVVVEDDGSGFNTTAPRSGNGLNNFE
ncbi:MAG: hypothetical protein KDN05_02370, partial [Verrucomicrobiae bacterium]|nr:hypothetical protein [Verrucomicrobiae bacterium]